jgi:hypothetical protein
LDLARDEIATSFNDVSPTICGKRKPWELAPDGAKTPGTASKKGRGSGSMSRDFAKAIRELWRAFGAVFDPYQPELHYMRGPGPKWLAKRAGVATSMAPELPQVAEVRA